MSAPLGAALAFMGLDGCLPMLHGAQGCTAFGLVLMVRHFRETIPLQTTALNEIQTILGGYDNLEAAIVNIHGRAKPAVIGICSTGLVETRGEDIPGDIRAIRARHPELATTALIYAQTPDFVGGLEEGWAQAVTATIEALVEPAPVRRGEAAARRFESVQSPDPAPAQNPAPAPEPGRRSEPVRRLTQRVAVLAGCHLTPGDLEEVRTLIEAFGLTPVILPDLSGSLDGHVPESYRPTTLGGTTVAAIRDLGSAALTLAIGELMRAPAEALRARAGVPFVVLDRLTGLSACDRLVVTLAQLSGRPVPERLRRQRSQLVDAMLDGHFHFGGRRIAVGAEPDLLFALTAWLGEMGATVQVAVAPSQSPVLAGVDRAALVIGDLDDLEQRADGVDLILTHAHGRQAAARLGVPLYRVGFPQFDRLGAAHQTLIGYRGTRDLIFAVGNALIGRHEAHQQAHQRVGGAGQGAGATLGVSLPLPRPGDAAPAPFVAAAAGRRVGAAASEGRTHASPASH